jgi:putative membrane protein
MKQRIIGVSVVAATVLIFATTGWGADTSTKAGSAKLSSGDANFVKEAAQGGMMEVQLGKIAQSKAANESVKDFGKRMEQDHTKANDELKKIAADKGVQVPSEIDKSHKSMVDKLEKSSGAKFDRDYMAAMVDDHKKDIKKFESAEKSKDPDVKNFASQTLPTLKAHLQLDESVNSKVKSAK